MLPRILLVEDDREDEALTLNALGAYHLANKVMVLRDGPSVLEYLNRRGPYAQEPPGNPVVILLDLNLPELDGLEVLQQIKADESLRTIPVVVLTGSNELRNLDDCYRLGANAYVVKPVRFAEFTEAVRQIGAFWAVINEPPPDVRGA
jgi:CheY-like chemotaxis protein